MLLAAPSGGAQSQRRAHSTRGLDSGLSASCRVRNKAVSLRLLRPQRQSVLRNVVAALVVSSGTCYAAMVYCDVVAQSGAVWADSPAALTADTVTQ